MGLATTIGKQVAPEFGSSREMGIGLQEQRDFSNPVVRFRRINGRVVPIVNKKRIGEAVNRAASRSMVAGAAITAAGAAAYGAKKALKSGVASTPKAPKKFAAKAASWMGNVMFPPQPPSLKKMGAGQYALSKMAKGSIWIGKKVARHPMKIGAGLLAAGVVGRIYGTNLEMESPFGKDFGAQTKP